MKLFLFCILVLPLTGISQDITGLWKGTMFNDSTRETLAYEILISKEKGKYSGMSHTWFTIGEKQYYGIKKVKVKTAPDGKIVILDDVLVLNNYPIALNKNVRQLNVLDLTTKKGETILEGVFVTNQTKDFKELTGKINIKRTSMLADSDLLSYLGRGNNDALITIKKK